MDWFELNRNEHNTCYRNRIYSVVLILYNLVILINYKTYVITNSRFLQSIDIIESIQVNERKKKKINHLDFLLEKRLHESFW